MNRATRHLVKRLVLRALTQRRFVRAPYAVKYYPAPELDFLHSREFALRYLHAFAKSDFYRKFVIQP